MTQELKNNEDLNGKVNSYARVIDGDGTRYDGKITSVDAFNGVFQMQIATGLFDNGHRTFRLLGCERVEIMVNPSNSDSHADQL
mgnify:FL=1